MKFGIGLNFAVPKPWKPNAESEVFRQNAELAILADELGLDTVWATGRRGTVRTASSVQASRPGRARALVAAYNGNRQLLLAEGAS
jgi:hypothetical protein